MMKSQGIIRSIAIWSGENVPVTEAAFCTVIAGKGVQGDQRGKGDRGITLLEVGRWADACRQVGDELPWTLRRANLLIDGLELASLDGCVLRMGDVRIRLCGETKPCGLMEKACTGLKAALAVDWRGGAHAEVLAGGDLAVGMPIFVEE